MPRTRSVVWSELKLGLVGVLALGLVATTIVSVGGEGGFFAKHYPLKVRFAGVQGLKPGAVVQLNGMEVGTVEAIQFAGTNVDVVLSVREDVRSLITAGSRASIGSVSLLGEPIVDVTAASGTPLADWGYVQAGGAGGPLGVLTESASASVEQVEGLLTEIRAGRGTLGKLVTDEALYAELEGLVAAAGDVTEAIAAGEGTLGGLINDPAAFVALRTSLANLETMTTRINAGEGALGRFLNDDAMGTSLANTMNSLDQVTARLRAGEGTLGRLMTDEAVFERLSGALDRTEQVMAGLNAGEGTAGQLLRDRQLYENMNLAVTELWDLLADIRADPRRFLRVSVSIF